MRLPDNIYELAKVYFGHHGCWHYLRLVPDDLGGQQVRDKCFPSGGFNPWPKGLRMQGQEYSGEDFFKFHRIMIRNFKWIITNAHGSPYPYVPWTDFPDWLSSMLDAMDPFYRRKLICAIEAMILGGSLDELGRFIEGSPDGRQEQIARMPALPRPNIHPTVHILVSVYEKNVFGPQTDCDMSNPYLAVYNEHFWRFHGWIDEIYARWQTAHGQSVEQSPLKPMKCEHMCPDCGQLFDQANPWLSQWQEYLQSRSTEID